MKCMSDAVSARASSSDGEEDATDLLLFLPSLLHRLLGEQDLYSRSEALRGRYSVSDKESESPGGIDARRVSRSSETVSESL